MSKKFPLFLLCLFIVFVFWYKLNKEISFSKFCPFCDASILESQLFYEEDLALALYTHKPIVPGHCLIIPKRHVERFEDLTEAEITAMGQVVKKVNMAVQEVFHTYPYLFIQKNGREVGQSVRHIHVHYIPRKTGEDSIAFFLFQMLVATIKKPTSTEDMQKNVDCLREAIIQTNKP